jgi:hypothetical protein
MTKTNPKAIAGRKRLPMDLVPATAIAEESVAYAEGIGKGYGAYNWRESEVMVSTYMAALQRHMARYVNGEDVDPVTGVSHLASARACLGIIIDARVCGTLIDDRPKACNISAHIDACNAQAQRVLHPPIPVPILTADQARSILDIQCHTAAVLMAAHDDLSRHPNNRRAQEKYAEAYEDWAWYDAA